MPVKVDQDKRAWVKVAAPPKKPKPKYVNRTDEREALCARLRYFACQPLDGRDRIRMLTRPVKGGADMVDVDRAPSPVPDQWTGAGLKFENGGRGGGAVNKRKLRRDRERGFDMESEDDNDDDLGHRVISEPSRAPRALSRPRRPSVIEAELLAHLEEQSLYDEDTRSHRSYRRTRRNEHYEDDPRPLASLYDARSQRSASPPPPPQTLAVRALRQRDPYPAETSRSTLRPQARHVTAPVTSRTTPRAVPLSTTYQFQSAIFQSKNSSNHYRNVYGNRNKNGSVGPGSWASATSALSFD